MGEFCLECQVDYMREAMSLLIHMGEKEGYEERKKSLQKKYHVSLETAEKKFELLLRIEAAMKEQLKNQQEELAFYFGKEREEGYNVGEAVLLWDKFDSSEYPTISKLSEWLSSLDEKTYNKEFGDKLLNFSTSIEINTNECVFKEAIDVVRFIMKMEIPQEEKWKMQQVYLEPEEHRKKVLHLLEQAIEVLQRFAPELEALAKEFSDYWTEKLKGSSIDEFMNRQIGLKLDENPYGSVLHPDIIQLNMVSLGAKADDNGVAKGPYNFIVGILFDDDFELNLQQKDSTDKTEYAMKVLKILSDSSKFEILSYIKDKKAYGSELAKQLNLTTATISHHMSALLKAGLVKMEKEDTKVYYSGNTEAIEDVLDYCRRILVEP